MSKIKTFASLSLFTLGTVVFCGCGVSPQADFPNALTGPNGEVILFDDVSAIISNPALSDDEKRDALRELGIEDERLIDALLAA